ncbi:MAG: diaminopimelate decarboxylase [Candidatus Methanofastidiosia archaeon]
MQNNQNKLTIGGINTEDLVKEFGSPLYVYDEETIKARYMELESFITYPKKRVHYAAKANSNLHILKLLKSLGAGIDAVSPGEVFLSLKAGFLPEDIIYTGINSTREELSYCFQKGVVINMGSLNHLKAWGENFPQTKVCIRINPDIGAGHHNHTITGGPLSKFGIYYNKIETVKEISELYGLDIVGVHAHIGSGILEINSFLRAVNAILDTAKNFDSLEFVDIGGGIGIPYRPDERPIDLETLGDRISQAFTTFCDAYGRQLELKIEPGRYIVGQAGTLLVTVNDIKSTPRYNFVGVDSGFNHLQRPLVYGAYHEIVNASNPNGSKKYFVVGGNICESGDVFTRDEGGIRERKIAIPQIGDILAIKDCGAYGYSMASCYNSRLLPAEVMVSNEGEQLIRRRQEFEDLLWGEV